MFPSRDFSQIADEVVSGILKKPSQPFLPGLGENFRFVLQLRENKRECFFISVPGL